MRELSNKTLSSSIGGMIFFVAMFCLGLYFTFTSVQGDFGLFRRVQINAETEALTKTRDSLAIEIAALSNKTLRLADDYLDLDLLDEQARDVLGLIRPDEVVIQ